MSNSNASPSNLKQQIARNLAYLMLIYHLTRREVCADLDIRYTTFTDWVKGNSYPRMDALEKMAYYFRIDVRDFLLDIPSNENLAKRLSQYASQMGVRREAETEGAVSGIPQAGATAADYYATPEGYPVELIRGHFFVMESPTTQHQSIVMELAYSIRDYIKKHRGKCRVFPGPFDVELPLDQPTVVVPDITVICDPNILDDHGCKGAPDWIIEVLSPSNRGRDLNVKRALYEEAGVREYWIIDPFHEKVHVHRLIVEDEETRYYISHVYLFEEEVTSGIYPGLTLRISEMEI